MITVVDKGKALSHNNFFFIEHKVIQHLNSLPVNT